MRNLLTVAAALLIAACSPAPEGTTGSTGAERETVDPNSLPLGEGVTLPEYERITLDNGLEIFLLRKADVPLIAFDVTVRGGALADADGRAGTASLTAELLSKGAGERDAFTFAETVASVGADFFTYSDDEYLGVFGQFMAKDQALMIELLADVLMRPLLDEEEFEQQRTLAIQGIQANKDGSPQSLMPEYFMAFVYGDHPLGRPGDGDETSLASISMGDVRDFHARHVGADRTQITMAGDFDPAALRSELEAAFGSWRQAAAPAPELSEPEAVTPGRVLLVDNPGSAQTYFRFGRLGVSQYFEDRAPMNLVRTAFGGRFTSMLNTALRIESGLTYGASQSFWQPGTTGTFYINSFTETSTTQEALDMALDVLDALHAEGLDEELLYSVQAYTLGQFAPGYETAVDLSDAIMRLEFYGHGPERISGYGDAVKATTLEDARRIIDSLYPQRDEMVLVLIGDADQIRDVAALYGEVTEMSLTDPSFLP